MAKNKVSMKKLLILWKWFINEYLPWYKRQQGAVKPMTTSDPPPPPPTDLP